MGVVRGKAFVAAPNGDILGRGGGRGREDLDRAALTGRAWPLWRGRPLTQTRPRDGHGTATVDEGGRQVRR